jgi:hypothetical protein
MTEIISCEIQSHHCMFFLTIKKSHEEVLRTENIESHRVGFIVATYEMICDSIEAEYVIITQSDDYVRKPCLCMSSGAKYD